MAFPRILEYLRVLDTTAQNARNLGKGAFSFPGMSQSHYPKGGSHGGTIWQSSVGLGGDAEVVGLCPSHPARIRALALNVQEGGGCVRVGKGSGNGRSVLGSLWHRSGERDTEGKATRGTGFPAKACLGSVPNPVVVAGREGQVWLLHVEQDEGTSGSSQGGEGEVAGLRSGGHPNLLWLCGAERAGASARAKRVRSGPGLGCTV